MHTQVLVSRPAKPIAHRMRELTEHSREFWIASAFLTREVVDEQVGTAIEAGANTRLLTGTFGNNTRKAVFARLLALHKQGKVETRIWDTGQHRRFHAKLYLWRLKGGASEVAWVGSSNFTSGGLRQDGELILELRARAGTATLAQLRRAFTTEWSRGRPIDQAFLDDYEQAAHPAPDFLALRATRRRVRGGRALLNKQRRNFIVPFTQALGERREAELRSLLGGTAQDADLFTSDLKSTSRTRAGDRGLVIDLMDNSAELVEVIDAVRVRGGRLIAHEPLFAR